MPAPQLKTHEQIHLDSEVAARATRRRAIRTVRANVPDLADQQELLATLGLLDDVEP